MVVVGGGAAGCEVAVNLAALSREAGSDAGITLVEAAPDLLPTSPRAARRVMRGHLGEVGSRCSWADGPSRRTAPSC